MPPRLLLALVALAAPAPASKAPDAGPAAAIDPCSDEGFKAASEALERAKAPADVKAALDRAIDLRSKDPALRARRLAQALASQAKGGPREQAEEDAAVLLEQDTHQPDAWGVLADRAEKAGQVELARALVARALFAAGKAPSASAWRARLGKRSSCTSAASRPDKGSSLSMVGGWVEAFKAIEELRMVHEEKPEPTTEAAARERVCVNNDLQEITERGVCKGAGPWTVQTGHMHFHDHMATLVPLDGKRMAVVQYITGDGCRGGSSSTATAAPSATFDTARPPARPPPQRRQPTVGTPARAAVSM